MAKAYIIKDANFNVAAKSFILTSTSFNNPRRVKILDQNPKAYIGGAPGFRSPTDTPFKVAFKSITVEGYSNTDVPPIGIAVVGFNNYIL